MASPRHTAARNVVLSSPMPLTPKHVRSGGTRLPSPARRQLVISHVPGGRSSSHQVSPSAELLDGLESLTCAPSFYDDGRSKQNGVYVGSGKQVKLLQPKPVAKGIRFVLPEPEPEPEPKPAAPHSVLTLPRFCSYRWLLG